MLSITFLFMIFCNVPTTANRVEIYDRGSSVWTCEDKGEYSTLCGTNRLPERIVCKLWLSGINKQYWECSPAQGHGWNLQHMHTCTTPITGDNVCSVSICTLHTIATPEFDLHPVLLLFLLVGCVLLCLLSSYSESDSFLLGWCAASMMEDDEWGGSSWS